MTNPGSKITKIIQEAFETGEPQTTHDLYTKVTESGIELDRVTMQHRIRSTLYSMKKSGQITHTETSTYVKSSQS